MKIQGKWAGMAKWAIVAVVFCLLLLSWLFKWFSHEEHKATWLWDTSIITKQTPEIIAFSKEQGVDTIFLQVQDEVPDEAYRKFIAAATNAEIEVHALNGHADWAYREKRAEGLAFIERVRAYNSSSAKNERFEGIQLDVEPYQLKRWENEESSVISEWQNNMEVWTEAGKAAGLYMSAAIPFWLDARQSAGGKETFSRWVISRFDAVAIMAYRDSGQQMYDLSKEELVEADDLGKRSGLEQNSRIHTRRSLDLFRKPISNMDEEMQKVFELGASHSSFAGVAVHHYEAWYAKQNGILLARKTEESKEESPSQTE